MPITQSTSFIGTAVEELFGQLVLGAETIEKGLVHVFPDKRNKVHLNKFTLAGSVLTTRVATPTANAIDYVKDERIITPGSHEFFQTFDPRDFGIADWRFLWPTGSDLESAPANELRRAILESTLDRVNEGIDTNMWQGDISAGTDPLQITQGFITIMAADVGVIDTTPAVISAANAISVFEAILAAMPAAVRESSNPTLICDHATKYSLFEAQRALDFKGVNVTEGGIPTYGGFPVVSVGGMPASTVVFTNAGTSASSNLKMSTWMMSDRTNIQIEPKEAASDLWFVRFGFDFGVNYINSGEVVLHQAS